MDGFTVTSLSAVDVPQRPVDKAVMVAVPLKAASQFITPLTEFITPAVTGNTEYDIEVLCAAVAVYVTSAPSWQTVVAPAVKTVAPMVALIVTTLFALVVPHSPVDVAVIVAVPKKAASQSITPVAGSIIPADAGNTEYTIDVLFSDVAV